MPVINLNIFSVNDNPNWDGTHSGIYNNAVTTASMGSSSTLSILDDDLLLSDVFADVQNGTTVDSSQQVIDGTTTGVSGYIHIDVTNATTGESGQAFLVTTNELSGALGWVFTIPVTAGDQINWQATSNTGDSNAYSYGEVAYADIVPCFVSGTLIRTQTGERLIEDLTAGDMVLTMDHGYQPIRWVGSSKRAATGDLAPILIRKGALDNDQDLRVSPQHRMLLQGWQAELLFGEHEVLATAKSLVNDHSIIRVEGGEVEYFHMLFDTHEIVWANGAPSESFHPGEQGWKGLDQATRDEILTLFPQLAEDNFDAYGPPARTSLKHKEGQVLGQYMTETTKDVLNNA